MRVCMHVVCTNNIIFNWLHEAMKWNEMKSIWKRAFPVFHSFFMDIHINIHTSVHIHTHINKDKQFLISPQCATKNIRTYLLLSRRVWQRVADVICRFGLIKCVLCALAYEMHFGVSQDFCAYVKCNLWMTRRCIIERRQVIAEVMIESS